MFSFGNLFNGLITWGATHLEGVKKGTADAQKIEGAPVVQAILHQAEAAAETGLTGYLGDKLGIEPSLPGVSSFLGLLIDKTPEIPTEAKEPLKILVGTKILGSGYVALDAPRVMPEAAQSTLEAVQDEPSPEYIAPDPNTAA